MFKVGQKVICKFYGEGEVTAVEGMYTYPVEVDFLDECWDNYTADGKLHEDDDEPSLSVIEE